jgi:hypothetical protein
VTNILRSTKEKNKGNFNERWSFLFNVVIDELNLRELEMSGRKFTWANNLHNPTYEKLYRVLMPIEWEQNFPLSMVQGLA